MNTLFQPIGKCQSCNHKGEELYDTTLKGKVFQFCSDCHEGADWAPDIEITNFLDKYEKKQS
jgi:hypothetical protein